MAKGFQVPNINLIEAKMTDLWSFENSWNSSLKFQPLDNELRRGWAQVKPYMHEINIQGPIFLHRFQTLEIFGKIQKAILKNVISSH